jgi:hypothetical protein
MAPNRKTAALLLVGLSLFAGSSAAVADWDTGPTGACKDCLVAQGGGKASLNLGGSDLRRYILRARVTSKAATASVTLSITATIWPSGGNAPGLKHCPTNQTSSGASGTNVAKVSCEIDIPAGQSVVIVATSGSPNTEDVELLAVPRGNY